MCLELFQNIYAIPVGDDFDNKKEACYLVYAPLANVFFLALPKEIEQLKLTLKNEISTPVTQALLNSTPIAKRNPYGVGYEYASTLYLLLNEKCNFNCRYCYSAGGRSKDEITSDQMKIALDYFLNNNRHTYPDRTVMFVGGGEPMLSWNLLKEGTEYAKKIASANNLNLKLRLSTNGSIISEERLEYLKENKFHVQFSFEVLEDIQKYQRGEYKQVDINLKTLLQEGLHCNIRSTITIENVDRIPEMVEVCYRNYPTIDTLLCEPVVDPDYFTSVEIVNDFHTRYFKAFTKALQLANQYGISLMSSNYGSIRLIRESFCFNLLCVTPFGTLTTCPNVSSPHEKDYDKSVFAKIENGTIKFDDEAYKRLTALTIHNNQKCSQCWAKWNCGAGCPNQRRVYTPEIFDATCMHYRNMLKYDLLIELSKQYYQKTHKDMFIDIREKLKA